MATMFTRTVKTLKATAYKTVIKNGKPESEVIGSVEYTDANDSDSVARQAFKAHGIHIPRGAAIYVETVSETVYGCTVEQFMAIAKPIER